MTALKAPCPHGRYAEHYFNYDEPEYCPGGSLLPPDSLVIVPEGDVIGIIGGVTTDPRWAHLESPLLLEFALSVLDALAAAQLGTET